MIAAAPTPTAPAQSATLRLDSRRKLLPLEFFSVLHGVDTGRAVELVENHVLWPCFNLARLTTGKRKIHVWRGSVEAWQPGQLDTSRPDLAVIIAAALPLLGVAPATSVTIRAVELGRRFCLGAETISNFIRAGELLEVGRHDPARESPRVSYVSAASFLERRVL